jgi:hypothetical protein
MSFPASLWNVLVARRLQVEVAFLEPVSTAGRINRHHVAEAASKRIAAWLGVPTPLGRRFNGARGPVVDTADSASAPAAETATKAR